MDKDFKGVFQILITPMDSRGYRSVVKSKSEHSCTGWWRKLSYCSDCKSGTQRTDI